MSKSSRLSWRTVFLVVLPVLAVFGIGLEASQWLFRTRAERLLADIKSIEVNRSTWPEAQKLTDRWGSWGSWYGNCTPADCQYDIAVRHLSLVYPDFQLEEGPHFGARMLELVGLRSAVVTARFHVVNGIVTEKGFGMSVALPVSDWVTPGDSIWLREKNGSGYWPRLDVASFEGTRLRGARLSTIAKNPNRGFIQRRITLEASFTPAEASEEKAALMDFHFDCITSWTACKSRADLLPRAAEEFEGGGPYLNK